jgi:hypothetical protein
MSTTADRLDTAAFPDDYADILIETLGIAEANYLNVKDALDHYRRLDDDRAAEVMRRIAEHEDVNPSDEPPPAADPAPYFRGASGRRYTYAEIADRLRREAPHTLGRHISAQLEAIGLLEEMQRGTTPCGLPFTFAKADCPFLVPAGSPLAPGKLYLRLYHGRKDPAEEMDDRGFDGPTFGPLYSVVQTYVSTIRLHGNEVDEELWLDRHDDMIVWDGAYYGDLCIFVAGRHDHG